MGFHGLETSFSAAKQELKSPADVLVVFIHWQLSRDGFTCVGAGEDRTGTGSELLPGGWNGTEGVYQLNYRDSDQQDYILKVIIADDTAICNLLRSSDNKNTDASILIQDYITDDISVFSTAYKSKEELSSRVEEIYRPLTEKKGGAGADIHVVPGPTKPQPEIDPLREIRRPRPHAGPPGEGIGPPRLGGSDLNPLGGVMGGGMIMDPTHGPRPMEPRWDPVGPADPFGPGFGGPGGVGGPGRGGLGGPWGPAGPGGLRGRGGGRGGRNWGDELPPPGWDTFDDNMFM